MEAKTIIDSPLSQFFEQNGLKVEICINRLEDTAWSLAIIAANGTSSVWDYTFDTDRSALEEALKAIATDGIASFGHQARGNG